jgi:plastocyanin
MTWLWRTCFSAACLLLVWPAAWCATVGGKVVLADSHDPAVRRHDFSGVVVWLESPAVRNAGRHALPSPARAQMVQKNKHFSPHILAVQVGAIVDFPNEDLIFHSAFSNYSGEIFDLGLYRPQSTKTVVFKRPGIVRIFCNIHPAMSAVIAVLDTPWFVVTDKPGDWRIHNVPPGDYQLHIFHERTTEETLRKLARRVVVPASGALTLDPITISETGYIPSPHTNKWGKDYPPVIDGDPAYGVRP